MKREREDSDDRDPTEVRQPRTGGHGKGRGGKQDRSRAPRSVPNMDTDSGDPQMKVEFTILRGMVGAVIGRGGNTVQGIRNRTGATVHIHSAMPKEKETSVELNGTRKQIEEAYDELRAVMTTVDEEYTENHDPFSMASLELRTLPKMIGCLIGKAGSKIRSIEEASGAKVKVEPQQDGDEFQDVIIHGNIDSVCKAHEMVQEALQSFDPTRAKTTRRVPHTNQSAANTAQSMNVVDLSAQSLVGGNVGKGMVTPMLSQHQQAPIVIQAPAGGLAPTPTILVLQADGTYIPAQVVNNMAPSAASYPPQMATAPVTLNSYQQQQQPMQQQQQQTMLTQQQNMLATQSNSALQAPQPPPQQQQQQQSPQQQQMFQPVPQSMLQQYTVAGTTGTAQQQQPQQQQQQQQPLSSNQQLAALLAAQQQQVLPIASTAAAPTATYVQGYGMGMSTVKMDSSGAMKLEMGDQGMNPAQTMSSQPGVPIGITTATSNQEQWDAPADTTYGTWNG